MTTTTINRKKAKKSIDPTVQKFMEAIRTRNHNEPEILGI